MNDKSIAVLNEAELITTMQNSLYPGAKAESLKMVISYCQAAGLDIMQKPVHIVPMRVRNPQTNQFEFRDTVMPGIGLYRIQADRSGTLAGVDEPEFGPDISVTLQDKNGNDVPVTYPEWCKISVKKLVGNVIVAFTAKEYWLENYATDSSKSTAPNAMWRKRPKGQIAKCAEAQALRKGWPEIGQAPTAEEMEGKVIDMGDVEHEDTAHESPEPELLPIYDQERFDHNKDTYLKHLETGKSIDDIVSFLQTKYSIAPDMLAQFSNLENTIENT